MKNIFTVLTLVVLSLFATSSFAGNVYFSGSGGLTILQDADNTAPGLATITSDFDNGWNAGGALGYDFGNFRTEFEIVYRENDVDNLKALGASAPAVGDVSATSYLFNGAYDFENSSSFTPYIEAGVGVAKVSINDVGVAGVTLVDDSATAFAYKIGLGTSYKATSSLDLTMGYYFFGVKDPEFTNLVGGDFDSEYQSHNINAGFKYNF